MTGSDSDGRMHSRPSLRTGQLSAATFTVDSTGDGADSDTTDGNCDDGNGACTLRAAIQQANAGVGGIIEFGIAGAGPHTIQPASALPTISKTVWLDGLSQPGAGVSSILIELDGTNAGTTTNGLIVAARGSWIRGLAINRFGAAGIVVQTGGAQVIEHNRIGTNPSGATDQGNGGVGVSIVGGTRVQIRSNVISGNGSHGVSVTASAAAGALVTDNVIGTDAAGTVDLGNDGVGVYISYAFASEVRSNVISRQWLARGQPRAREADEDSRQFDRERVGTAYPRWATRGRACTLASSTPE